MERYGTDHKVGDETASVYTKPKKTSRMYRYPLHRRGGMWVLSREKDWYTEHALRYAEREIDGDVLRRHVPPSQTELDDFKDTGGGVQSLPETATGEAD